MKKSVQDLPGDTTVDQTLAATIDTKHESRPSPPPNNLFTYRRIRKMIGLLGFALPIVLILFSFFSFFKTEVQPSISHYYYTNLREIFTGTLCGVGLFLICYKGYDNPVLWKNDNFLTNFAGIMAFGVAFFPTFPGSAEKKNTRLSQAALTGWDGCIMVSQHYCLSAFPLLPYMFLPLAKTVMLLPKRAG